MDIGIRSRKTTKSDYPIVNDGVDEEAGVKKFKPFFTQENRWITSVDDKVRLFMLTMVGFYLRGMKLGFPYFVTDLELETTRQVNWYMQGKFFIGQFPPLTGLINVALARLVGYYGTENLSFGGQHFDKFPLAALRRLAAMFGTALIPLCYITMRNLGHSRPAATLAAGLLIFENGMITESRYTSPEIFALAFAATATCSWTLMQRHLKNNNQNPNMKAYMWNVITGICTGLSLSSKWTGIMCFPVLWFSVGYELWNKLIKEQHSLKSIAKQLMTYIVTLIIVPLFVYLTVFKIHFDIVPNSGDHDFSLSTHLKYSLEGNNFDPTQPNIAYGSRLMLKHVNTVGGYLHSHQKYYSKGSGQQEVLLYPHIDLNNIWTIYKHGEIWNSSLPVEFVRNHDTVRLEHFASTRKLHSHDIPAPVSAQKKEHNEVSAYGDRLINDPHDFWNLQIFNENGEVDGDKNLTFKPLVQKFRLIHVRGCVLSSAENFHTPNGEQEVTCMASASQRVTEWMVETSYHELLTGIEKTEPTKLSFFEKLKEVHSLMIKYPFKIHSRLQSVGMDNLALIAEYIDESPKTWFIKRSSYKVWSLLVGYSSYVFVHPLIQKFTFIAMGSTLLVVGVQMFISKRQLNPPAILTWPKPILGIDNISASELYTKSIVLFYSASLSYVLFLGSLPAFMLSMLDILPSFYYGVGLFAVCVEVATLRLRPFYRRTLFYGILLLVIMVCSELSFLVYGGQTWARSQCEKSKLELDCIRFPLTSQELYDIQNDESNNSTLTVVPMDLPGYSQPFKYHLGNEAQADSDISITKQFAYQQAIEEAPDGLRYLRVLPTPAITPDEAHHWRQENIDQATKRERKIRNAKMEQWAQQNNQTLYTYMVDENDKVIPKKEETQEEAQEEIRQITRTVTVNEQEQVEVVHQKIVYVTAGYEEGHDADFDSQNNRHMQQNEQPIIPKANSPKANS